MINNKGYVFTSITIVFILIVALSVVLFKQEVADSVNQALYLQGMVDKINNEYDEMILTNVTAFKLATYEAMSNSSTIMVYNESIGGYLDSNNPQVPLIIEGEIIERGAVNLSFNELVYLINFSYPLTDLMIAEDQLLISDIQQCLDDASCSEQRESYETLLMDCLSDSLYNDFTLTNSSVPLLFGPSIFVELILTKSGTYTELFPFWLGSFSFDC